MQKSVIYLVTEVGYFYSHRLSLAQAARDAGYRVIVATSGDLSRLERDGFEVVSIPFIRGSLNPFFELLTFVKIFIAYYKLKPDVLHHVALKPVIYGSIAAGLLGMPSRIVNMLGGLGYVFTSSSIKARLLRTLVKLGLKVSHLSRNSLLVVQNLDDMAAMSEIISPEQVHLILGSGVDTDKLKPSVEPKTSSSTNVVLVGRMLWTKGVGELVEAYKLLYRLGIKVEIHLIGDTDPQNPAHIDKEVLEKWQEQQLVHWHGQCTNVADLYVQSDIAVLPSYREGLPKSLLEAASLGKPIITTDAPGCREVIEDGISGLLVPPRDSQALAGAIKTLVESEELRNQMGQKARERALSHFDIKAINRKTLDLYCGRSSSNLLLK